ncbi:UDP-glucose 4-epimerase GalE [Entomobacter blattae]|uniref:UDP-glucose 4-epimerase n=1 Tax=Entomobacter blattae TaxID=2762277 RepID=A0A7H1NQB1_9PROT|nr:UDP-glucose 4-epimerase GalE [Entomobacter blattae]QNT77971.1 UDP-glucose 4-epimerase [Entomobacter blattae]
MGKYLVTGGAGYVGIHVVLALLEAGHEVAVLDNLSRGHRKYIPKLVEFFKIDLADKVGVEQVVASQPWDGVLHFAALSLVGESMRDPFLYLRQNYMNSLNLIEACVKHGIKRFVFSSTAALFGGVQTPPIADTAPIDPGSPYGESKFMIERVLVWAERVYGMYSASLRYFNAAGADPKGRAGEDHTPETHLIPLTIDAALGYNSGLKVFGNNYPTRDGTCVRDYIHVNDLASAHLLAMEHIKGRSVRYNLGNGQGFTNLEVIQSVERVTGKKVPWEWAAPRFGDPDVLVADSARIRQELGWKPEYTVLDQIIETAVRWRVAHPNGYSSLKQKLLVGNSKHI